MGNKGSYKNRRAEGPAHVKRGIEGEKHRKDFGGGQFVRGGPKDNNNRGREAHLVWSEGRTSVRTRFSQRLPFHPPPRPDARDCPWGQSFQIVRKLTSKRPRLQGGGGSLGTIDCKTAGQPFKPSIYNRLVRAPRGKKADTSGGRHERRNNHTRTKNKQRREKGEKRTKKKKKKTAPLCPLGGERTKRFSSRSVDAKKTGVSGPSL